MDNLVTTDSIIHWIQEQVKNRQPIDSSLYMDIAFKLNSLLQDDQSLLFTMQQEIAQNKKTLLEDPTMSVSKAKIFIEASEEYKKMKNQEAKVVRVIETIRISKAQARLSQEVFNSNI